MRPDFRSSGLTPTLGSRGEVPSVLCCRKKLGDTGWLEVGAEAGGREVIWETVISKRSSPHDFLYLVPVASLQAP